MKKKSCVLLLIVCWGSAVYSQSGVLDTTYGNLGKTIININSTSEARNKIALQSDGKIITATSKNIGGKYDFCVIRLYQNGFPDNTFGSNGTTTTDIGSDEDLAFDLIVQSDDKIIVIGTSGNYKNYDFTIVRYLPDGEIDSSFGVNGIANKNVSNADILYSVAIQTDGKIIVGGMSNNQFCILRYNIDGTLDNTFGNDGIASITTGSMSAAYSICLQQDAKIIAVGQVIGSTANGLILRLDSDGDLDYSFGTNGKKIIDFGSNEYLNSVIVKENGNIIIAGAIGSGSGSSIVLDYLIFELLEDGTFNSAFNNDGILQTDFAGSLDICNKVLIENDNKILAIGYSVLSSNKDLSLLRVTPDGQPDSTFGINGKIKTDFGSDNDIGQGAVFDYNNRLLVSGLYGSSNNVLTCRYITSIYDGLVNIQGYKEQISFYPNPFNNELKFVLNKGKISQLDISLYNSAGIIVKKGLFNNVMTANIYCLFLNNLPAGSYYLVARYNNLNKTVKLIKE